MTSQTFENKTFDKDFSKMLLVSVCFHVSVICVFALKVLFFPDQLINYQSAIRVDMVALPEKTMEAAIPAAQPSPSLPTPAEAKTPTKQEPAKDNTKINLKKKQSKALERLKALQELEDEVKQAKENEKKKTLVKGNILAAGSSLKGLNKLDYDTYIGEIDNQIKANWALPEWLAKAGLRARALVKIDERGYVIKKELILSSNNPTYDSLVLDAIDRSSPFPAPPEKFVNLLGVDGIVFQFPD